jgi:hypothetical protein
MSRSDKVCCTNSCAVKYIYARKHNFDTPLDSYNKMIGESVEYNEPNPISAFKSERQEVKIKNNSGIDVDEIQQKIIKYSTNLKNIKNG